LSHYLSSLRNADAMFGLLRQTLQAQPAPAVLGFYGDHLPSFPTVYPKLGFTDAASDYLIWCSQRTAGAQQALAAEDMAAALLKARRSTAP
jgi:hypothetical protein